MKSVKSKLFVFYSLIVSVILLFVVLFSTYFFQLYKSSSILELLETTDKEINKFVKSSNNEKIANIDKYIDLKNQFLIIFKNGKLLFTNQSKFRTQKIINEINNESRGRHRHKNEHKLDYQGNSKEIENYIFTINVYEKNSIKYKTFIGLDKRFDTSLGIIYNSMIVIVGVLLVILLVSGYILINKTIKPLKQILKEMKIIEESDDLTKRLKSQKTKDEFEEIVNSFNKMRDNIEASVENIKQFSSDASHELKTPLTIIQGEIELIKNKNLKKDEIINVIEKIDNEQKKLNEIISNFLLLSRLDKESIKKSKSFLDIVTLEVVEENLDKLEEKNLELKLELDEDLEVNFSKRYLYIVLNNLITNAIKYTEKGYIKIEAYKDSQNTIFSIEDSGIGINKKDQEKIFERFYRVDESRTDFKNGVGLGLSIVKKICTRFNSKIELISIENKGTIFKIKFTKISK